MIILFLFFQTGFFEKNQILQFADYLYLQADFNGALNEYRRYIFLGDDNGNKQEVYEKIVDCLVRLKRYDEAIASTKNYSDTAKAVYTKSKIYLFKGNYPMVRELLKSRIGEPETKHLIGLSYVAEFNFLKAKEFMDLPEPLPRNKNPLLGGLLSLFPGGGHYYCGRIGDGIYSTLVITTGSLISYYYYHKNEKTKFYFSFGISIIFYAGNIYGGINAVRNYNYYKNSAYQALIFNRN